MFRLLLYFVLLHAAVLGQPGHVFGTSYLKNSLLCHQWTCLNTQLGLPDSLPPKDGFITALRSLLPQGPWQDVVEKVATTCYEDRPRMYTNTCPGQALMHCAVDQMIQNCPEGSLRKEDACSPLTSLAGFKYMFSQSRYKDLEKNYPKDRRPEWFLKNYFSSKCCNLPDLFNSTAQGCKFDSIIRYHDHELKEKNPSFNPYHKATSQQEHRIALNVKLLSDVPVHISEATSTTAKNVLKIVNPDDAVLNMDLDPLECCDLSGFIEPSWREECGFHLSWSERDRLTILNNTHTTTTTVAPSTTARPKLNDVKVLPLTSMLYAKDYGTEYIIVLTMGKNVWNLVQDATLCEKETCVFRKLNIVSETGAVDLDAFSKLLDNMTAKHYSWTKVTMFTAPCEKETCVFRKLNIVSETGAVDFDGFSKLLDNMTAEHNSWSKAKARVVTKCLSKPIGEYIDDCEINRVLACTFDILSENCPHAPKHDSCKHTTILKKDTTCQISSSRLRPKNRRQFCGIPNLVNHEVLSECGVESISRMEFVPDPVTSKPKTHWWASNFKYACQGSTDSTKCLLKKMGVLNKYGFLDYFKMKDRIREFSSNNEWSALTEVYLNTFTSIPMYGQQCSTPKKFLNVLDAMLMTCPISKRKTTLQCNRILTDIAHTAPAEAKINRAKITQFRLAEFYPPPPTPYKKLAPIPEQPIIHKNPTYDFGFLNSKDAPKVEIIDIKPTSTRKPLVLLPVYMRMRINGTLPRPYDGIFRSAFQPNMP